MADGDFRKRLFRSTKATGRAYSVYRALVFLDVDAKLRLRIQRAAENDPILEKTLYDAFVNDDADVLKSTVRQFSERQ